MVVVDDGVKSRQELHVDERRDILDYGRWLMANKSIQQWTFSDEELDRWCCFKERLEAGGMSFPITTLLLMVSRDTWYDRHKMM